MRTSKDFAQRPLAFGDPAVLCPSPPLSPDEAEPIFVAQGEHMAPTPFAIFASPSLQGKVPVVIFMHGVPCNTDGGNLPKWYDIYSNGYRELFGCLREQFVIVSVRPGSKLQLVPDRAALLLMSMTPINDALDFHLGMSLTNNSVMLMGHSRGGEAVILAANTFNSLNLQVALRGVIAIAPAEEEVLTLNVNVPNLLVIEGTFDGDTRYPAALNNYLRAISPDKYLALVHGAGHNALVADWATNPMHGDSLCEHNIGSATAMANASQIISFEDARRVTAKLIKAFLRWKVLQDWDWADYFHNAGPIDDEVPVSCLVRESGEVGVGGEVYVQGFTNLPNGPMQKQSVSSWFYNIPLSGYSLAWQEPGVHRVYFVVSTKPAPGGTITFDVGILKVKNGSPTAANEEPLDVGVTLLSNCNHPLGCGVKAVPVGYSPDMAPPVFSLASPAYITYPEGDPIVLQNWILSFVIPIDAFEVDAQFLQDTVVLALDFFTDQGDIVLFEPRFRA